MRARIADRLDWRLNVTVAAGVTTSALMIVTGMEPRLVLVGFVVAIVGAATWLAVDLGPVAARLEWAHDGSGATTAARSDHRVRSLRRRLRTSNRRRRTPISADATEPVDEVAAALLAIIDDHLADEFGVDRREEPVRAADVLGSELTRFVTEPAARRSMTGRRRLARTVSLVEDLCARTRAD